MFSRLEVPDADKGFFFLLEGKKGKRRKERNEEKKNVHGQAALDVCRNWEIVFCDPPTGCFNEQDLTLVLHARAQSEKQRCKVSTVGRRVSGGGGIWGVEAAKASNWRPFVWPTAPERTVC